MASGTPLYGDRSPTIGQYVVIAGSDLLDNERILTGTSNQIVVTDNGAGSTVVLSTPQDIHTGASPTFAGVTLTAAANISLTNIVAAGESLIDCHIIQGDDDALTGTLRGAYITASCGDEVATGTIRGIEMKARAGYPGETGANVNVLEGFSVSSDAKTYDVTTHRGGEIILDGGAGTSTLAVGLRIANNFQADRATTSYGLQIYRDSFDYTADIQLSSSGLIGGASGHLKIDASGNVTIGNTALHLLDTNDSHDLIIKPGSDLSADRILTLTTGDAARTITLSGNPTLNDWFDQAVKQASAPTFAQLTIDNLRLDGNAFSSLSGGMQIVPLAGQNLSVTLSTTGDFSVNTSIFVVDTSTGRVGIGTATPAGAIDVIHTLASIFSRSFSGTVNTAQSALQLGLSGAGTFQTGSGPSMLFFAPDDGGSKKFMGRVTAVWENNTAGSEAAALIFSVRANTGDIFASTERMRITSGGNVGIGISASILGKLHIDQASSTGAIPVLFLDQGDVSEQCIQFSSDATDRDIHLFTVNVTGAPAMDWLETPDIFSLTKGIAIGDGGITNYAAFAADGELALAGTARVESEFTVQAVNLDKGSQGPDAVILDNTLGYSYDIGDDSVFSFEIPYDCDTSANLTVEVYWYIDEARDGDNQEVQFRLQWSACPADESEAVDGPTHTGTIDFGDQLIPETAKFLTEFSGTISAASIADADYISCTLDRVALDGGNDPTADPVVVQVEIEYVKNKLGKAT